MKEQAVKWQKVLNDNKVHTITGDVRIIENFDMPQLETSRRVWIYLPPSYELSDKRYPAVYMHDGQNVFDEATSGYGEWGVDENMEALAKENPEYEAIVVAVDCHPEQRSNEYNVVESETHNINGVGDQYISFLADSLKPYIDANYRTFPDRSHTTIAGSSFGAYISLYATLKYPEIFGRIAAFSLMTWQDGGHIEKLIKATHPSNSVRYYINIGDSEGEDANDAEELVAMATNVYQTFMGAGYDDKAIKFEVVKGGRHHESTWRKTFSSAYKWWMQDFQ